MTIIDLKPPRDRARELSDDELEARLAHASDGDKRFHWGLRLEIEEWAQRFLQDDPEYRTALRMEKLKAFKSTALRYQKEVRQRQQQQHQQPFTSSSSTSATTSSTLLFAYPRAASGGCSGTSSSNNNQFRCRTLLRPRISPQIFAEITAGKAKGKGKGKSNGKRQETSRQAAKACSSKTFSLTTA